MLTIALTGGIGSGKTAVTDCFLKIAGQNKQPNLLAVIDADSIARKLLSGSLKQVHCTALDAVYNLFGSKIFNSAGQLDRAQLRSLIFSSETKKQQLNELLHPLVYKEIFTRIAELTQQSQPSFVIIAIPLLFETGAETQFDRILVIDAPTELQIKRSSQRDHCSAELIKKIIRSQAERQTRLNHADDIIDNSGNMVDLEKKVTHLYQFYCALSKKTLKKSQKNKSQLQHHAR